MVEVHGLPEPPEGFDAAWQTIKEMDRIFAFYEKQNVGLWRVAYNSEVGSYGIVARRKWEPKLEVGKAYKRQDGERVQVVIDASNYHSAAEYPVLGFDDNGNELWYSPSGEYYDDGEGEFDIIGPWEEPEQEVADEPLQVGDRVKVLPRGDDPTGLWKNDEYAHEGDVGTVIYCCTAHSEYEVEFDFDCDTWSYSRCQLEKLPTDQPAIDPGEGYRLIDFDVDVRTAGDEMLCDDGDWIDIATQDCGVRYSEASSAKRHIHYRRKLEPAWTPPEWAKGLGWMTQDEGSEILCFFANEPVCDNNAPIIWSRSVDDYRHMPITTAKLLNLYPPHWETLPASERCLNLGGE